MSDKIVNPDDYDWTPTGKSGKGRTKYRHLLDGNAREIDIRDYGYDRVDTFRITLANAARTNGLKSRAKKLDDYTLLFQVTGKREQK